MDVELARHGSQLLAGRFMKTEPGDPSSITGGGGQLRKRGWLSGPRPVAVYSAVDDHVRVNASAGRGPKWTRLAEESGFSPAESFGLSSRRERSSRRHACGRAAAGYVRLSANTSLRTTTASSLRGSTGRCRRLCLAQTAWTIKMAPITIASESATPQRAQRSRL
jgi:hypothetical protein